MLYRLGMCMDPRYFELFVSGSKYQHSNLFELVRSRFEQSNSSNCLNCPNSSRSSNSSNSSNSWDSSDSSNSSNSSKSTNSSDSSDSSDHSRRWKQQNRWLRLTENSKWRIRTQQTNLFNGICYFAVFEHPAYEFDVKIQNSKCRMPTANKLQKMTSMKFGTRRLSRSLIVHLNLKFKKANLV